MRRWMLSSVCLFACTAMVFPAQAEPEKPLRANQTWHVSPTGDNRAHDGLSAEQPFKTIQHAVDRSGEGDTILVYTGVYSDKVPTNGRFDPTFTPTGFDAVAWVPKEKRGLTIRNAPGQAPTIELKGARIGIHINGARDTTIEGITFIGNNQLTPADKVAKKYPDPVHPMRLNTAIWVDKADRPNNQGAWGVTIRGCTVKEFGGNGMSIAITDTVLIENNTVSRCGLYSESGNSGISICGLIDNPDDQRTHRVIVRNNVLFENENLFPFTQGGGPGYITDGNGVICDYLNSQGYTGRVLIENNVAYNNGGSGLQAFHSDRVDFVHNTAVNNSLTKDLYKGGITVGKSKDCKVINNIIVGKPTKPLHQVFDADGLAYDHNLHFDGDSKLAKHQLHAHGKNDVTADPMFIAPDKHDYRLKPGSPAIDKAASFKGGGRTDAAGTPRPSGPAADLGAYEWAQASDE